MDPPSVSEDPRTGSLVVIDPNNPTCPVETIWFGDNYKGELVYSDKAKKTVYIINAWMPPQKKSGGAQQHAGAGTTQ